LIHDSDTIVELLDSSDRGLAIDEMDRFLIFWIVIDAAKLDLRCGFDIMCQLDIAANRDNVVRFAEASKRSA